MNCVNCGKMSGDLTTGRAGICNRQRQTLIRIRDNLCREKNLGSHIFSRFVAVSGVLLADSEVVVQVVDPQAEEEQDTEASYPLNITSIRLKERNPKYQLFCVGGAPGDRTHGQGGSSWADPFFPVEYQTNANRGGGYALIHPCKLKVSSLIFNTLNVWSDELLVIVLCCSVR